MNVIQLTVELAAKHKRDDAARRIRHFNTMIVQLDPFQRS